MATSFSNPMQVTISLLPTTLSLVHIPRSRLVQLSHPILSQILQPNPTFLNITCNEVELSLFAEEDRLAEFEVIARRDRHRQRSRAGSSSSHKQAVRTVSEPVEISYEKWNVLQIESHTDPLDNSGARVRELSTPLAEAGISILYQSSYMCDFIFVKESRLQEVMRLFTSAGFDMYESDANLLTSRMVSPMFSPMISPTFTDDGSSIMELALFDSPAELGTVLTRSQSDRDFSSSTSSSKSKRRVRSDPVEDNVASSTETVQTTPKSRSNSHSPSSGEVRVLPTDLACVGLSDDSADHWGLKIVKLVAFPELIPAAPLRSSDRTATSESLRSLGRAASPVFEPYFRAPSPDSSGRRGSPPRSASSSSDEEGYFSHSPSGSISESTCASSLSTSGSRSQPDLLSPLLNPIPSFKPPSKHLISPLTPIEPISKPAIHPLDLSPMPSVAELPKSQSPVPLQSKVPFFSFTRTAEGSSLTTDVSLLAALFPPSERHMVICSGELDAADERANSNAPPFDELDIDDDDEDGESTLKCLQIDLRKFGLDKHGLVNRFSRVLEENNINHMYSSTFKTANLLVKKRHAARAQSLLRSC